MLHQVRSFALSTSTDSSLTLLMRAFSQRGELAQLQAATAGGGVTPPPAPTAAAAPATASIGMLDDDDDWFVDAPPAVPRRSAEWSVPVAPVQQRAAPARGRGRGAAGGRGTAGGRAPAQPKPPAKRKRRGVLQFDDDDVADDLPDPSEAPIRRPAAARPAAAAPSARAAASATAQRGRGAKPAATGRGDEEEDAWGGRRCEAALMLCLIVMLFSARLTVASRAGTAGDGIQRSSRAVCNQSSA